MKLSIIAVLVSDSLRRHKRNFSLAVIGVTLATILLVFFAGVGGAVRAVLIEQLLEELPAGQLIVKPKRMNLLFLNFSRPGILGGGDLDRAALVGIKELPETAAAFPQLEFSLPSSVRGELFGQGFRSDIAISGVDPEQIRAVHGEVPAEFKDTKGVTAPALVSSALVNMYNENFASGRGLPGINPDSIIGFELELVLGRSYIGTKRDLKIKKRRARIVGFTDSGATLGLTLPIDTVRRYLSLYGKSTDKEQYRQVLVLARSNAEVPALSRKLEGMGFAVQSSKGEAELVSAAILLVVGVLTILGVAVLVIAALNIASTFALVVGSRLAEFGILRASGASRRLLLVCTACEALVLAGFGAGLGIGASCLGLYLAAGRLNDMLQGIIDIGGARLIPPAGILALLAALVLAVTIAAALLPARRFFGRSIVGLLGH